MQNKHLGTSECYDDDGHVDDGGIQCFSKLSLSAMLPGGYVISSVSVALKTFIAWCFVTL